MRYFSSNCFYQPNLLPLNPFSPIIPLIPSAQVRLGLPRFLLPDGRLQQPFIIVII